MADETKKAARRTYALSRDRVVEGAIAILDSEGEDALTFRKLAARLGTGAGAIYWHIADKQDLMAAAAYHVVAGSISEARDDGDPHAAIRRIASEIFDAIDARHWLGAQLVRNPLQDAGLCILEAIGSEIRAIGIPEAAQFNASTAVLSFIFGLAGQYASAIDHVLADGDRATFLRSVASRWSNLDADRYPFVRHIAAQLPDHDDREQFLAGIDLILAGIDTVR